MHLHQTVKIGARQDWGALINRITAAQEACSFQELTIVPQFGTMPYDEAMASTELFAKEVLPAVQKMDAPLHRAALPENALA